MRRGEDAAERATIMREYMAAETVAGMPLPNDSA